MDSFYLVAVVFFLLGAVSGASILAILVAGKTEDRFPPTPDLRGGSSNAAPGRRD